MLAKHASVIECTVWPGKKGSMELKKLEERGEAWNRVTWVKGG